MVPRKIIINLIPPLFTLLFTVQALAHVPYLEINDFSWENPFVVKKSIQQSIAVYSYLDCDDQDACEDIDVYEFEIGRPQDFYAEIIVPVCGGYEYFTPSFMLIGPGLPDPSVELPFSLPDGYGVIIMEDSSLGEDRETFYEFFGNKSYYQGPVLDTTLDTVGVYYVAYWDPSGGYGDYVAVLGDKEIWLFWDIIRALIVTPLIRMDKELHYPCE